MSVRDFQGAWQGSLGQFNQGLGAYQSQGGGQPMVSSYVRAWMQAQEQKPKMSGNKPVVVCGGEVNEAKNMDDAQRMAEESAHAKGKTAYILKPVRMVAPKRDVVTTDL